MCWSFEVSVGFALVEAICIAFVTVRALRSKDKWVRAQLYNVPVLSSICAIEICEAFLWLDTNMSNIDDPIHERPCTPYNKAFTFVIWMIILPSQPFWCIFPLKRVGNKRNYYLMQAVEGMAIFYCCFQWLCYIMQQIAENFDEDFVAPLPREYIKRMDYMTFSNSETCTYKGLHGHLFWTVNIETDWCSPNGVTYGIFWLAVPFARPWRFSSIMGLPLTLSIYFLIFYFEYSPEVMSVWCWSGFISSIYAVLQPYFFPCTGVYEYWDHTMLEDEKETENNNKCSNGSSIHSAAKTKKIN